MANVARAFKRMRGPRPARTIDRREGVGEQASVESGERGVAARLAILASAALLCVAPAAAEPWASVGDAGLRSDITLLAQAGLLDSLTTQWPMPWTGVAAQLSDDAALARLPRYIQNAARRVRARAEADTAPGLRAGLLAQGTNQPALIRGFDALGNGKGQLQGLTDWNHGDTSVHLALGAISGTPRDRGRFAADGSVIAQRIGAVTLYGGAVSHWWGPGWVSALSYSNNARPIPQIGIASSLPHVFKTPLLSWIGPWRAEFVYGILDGPRLARNTLFNGLRVTFNPAPGLEIGLARTQFLCGTGHSCNPLSDYFNLQNDGKRASPANDQGVFDIKYSNRIGGRPFEIYTQILNEDSNPIVVSSSSYLVGASIWLPVGDAALRLTGEYVSSIATADLFSFNRVSYGNTYNNGQYPDGARYRGRTVGFSLDSDSRLASVQGSLTDTRGRTWTLGLHHAIVSTPFTGTANPITTTPVTINYAEAQASVPTRWADFRVAARLQDDQPRPRRGVAAAIEATLIFRLR